MSPIVVDNREKIPIVYHSDGELPEKDQTIFYVKPPTEIVSTVMQRFMEKRADLVPRIFGISGQGPDEDEESQVGAEVSSALLLTVLPIGEMTKHLNDSLVDWQNVQDTKAEQIPFPEKDAANLLSYSDRLWLFMQILGLGMLKPEQVRG